MWEVVNIKCVGSGTDFGNRIDEINWASPVLAFRVVVVVCLSVHVHINLGLSPRDS